jgi:hypothetical protein
VHERGEIDDDIKGAGISLLWSYRSIDFHIHHSHGGESIRLLLWEIAKTLLKPFLRLRMKMAFDAH